jgi:hypothetical protein
VIFSPDSPDSEPVATPGVTPLAANGSVTLRVPVYRRDIYKPETRFSCARPVIARYWAEVVYTVGNDFRGPLGGHRLTYYDDVGEELQSKFLMDSADFWAAQAAERRGDHNSAIALFTRSIEREPALPEPISQRGDVFLETGQLDAATADFRRAIALAPSAVRYYRQLVDALHRTHREAEALPILEEGLTLRPPVALHALRGEVYEALGRRSAAIADYQSALQTREDTFGENQVMARLRNLGVAPWHPATRSSVRGPGL